MFTTNKTFTAPPRVVVDTAAYGVSDDETITAVNTANASGFAGGSAHTASSIYSYHYTASAEL